MKLTAGLARAFTRTGSAEDHITHVQARPNEGTKSFLLSLGAQKAGTSWLHDFLSMVATVQTGYAKELHVFDRIDFPQYLKADLKRLGMTKSRKDVVQRSHLWNRLSMVADTNRYFDYFEHILSKSDVHLTGDFTPVYSLLSEKRLAEIKRRFEQRGIQVKVIFLMRDPVERIWSAERMNERNFGVKRPILECYKVPGHEARTRYETIIPKLRKVFPPESLYINFYENLFTEETVGEILQFLELPATTPNFDKRVNASAYQDIADADREVVRKYYADTYDFVRREFADIYPEKVWG